MNPSEKKFEILIALLKLLKQKLKTLELSLLKLERKIEGLGGRVETLGGACHTGFLQVRDACHIFREELSEASGRMVEESWR